MSKDSIGSLADKRNQKIKAEEALRLAKLQNKPVVYLKKGETISQTRK